MSDLNYKERLYTEIFPEIKDNGILERVIAVVQTGITSDFESRFLADGLKYWFRFVIVKQGGLLIVTTEDVTKRKRKNWL